MLQPGVYKYTILLQLSARRQCNLMNAFLFACFSACPLWWHVLYKINFLQYPNPLYIITTNIVKRLMFFMLI